MRTSVKKIVARKRTQKLRWNMYREEPAMLTWTNIPAPFVILRDWMAAGFGREYWRRDEAKGWLK